MAWFETRTSKQRKSAVMNAICVMMADGKIAEEEMAVLGAVGARAGLTEAELQDLLDNPESVKFTPPDTIEERFGQVSAAVFMMMVDGEIDAREFAYCCKLAKHLGFDADGAPAMVKELIKAIQDDIDPAKLLSLYAKS